MLVIRGVYIRGGLIFMGGLHSGFYGIWIQPSCFLFSAVWKVISKSLKVEKLEETFLLVRCNFGFKYLICGLESIVH